MAEMMNPDERERFIRALRVINDGVRSGRLKFDSVVDGGGNVYFRYSLMPKGYPLHRFTELSEAVEVVVSETHAGRAVRFEDPDDGSVMIIPRLIVDIVDSD